MFAPAKTPRAVLAKLEQHVRTALAQPDVRERFVKLGLHPIGDTSAEFHRSLQMRSSAWAKRRAWQALRKNERQSLTSSGEMQWQVLSGVW